MNRSLRYSVVLASLSLVNCGADPNRERNDGSALSNVPSPGGLAATSGAAGASATETPTNGGTSGAPSPSGLGGMAGVAGTSSTTVTTGGVAGAAESPDAGGAAGASGGQNAGGAPGTSNGCDSVASLFCDDFEEQTEGQAPSGPFGISGPEGSIVVDGSRAFSGTQALHLSSPAPAPNAMLEFSDQFPTNDLHGRAMFYLARIPSASVHWDIVYSYSQNDVQWEIGGMFGDFILVVDPPDHGLNSDPFPTEQWFCLQWEFGYGEGGDNTFVAKMNGAPLENGEFTGADPEGQTWNAGPWRSLAVGWTVYGSSDVDIDMWIDDLAFGTEAIACPEL